MSQNSYFGRKIWTDRSEDIWHLGHRGGNCSSWDIQGGRLGWKLIFSSHSGQLKCLKNLQDLDYIDYIAWDYMDGQLKTDYKLCSSAGEKLRFSWIWDQTNRKISREGKVTGLCLNCAEAGGELGNNKKNIRKWGQDRYREKKEFTVTWTFL